MNRPPRPRDATLPAWGEKPARVTINSIAGTGKIRTHSTPLPPFRADHVGSLLRPPRLKLARERQLGPQTADRHLGPHDDPDLRRIEDECIRAAIAMQERAGLNAVTDGEF